MKYSTHKIYRMMGHAGAAGIAVGSIVAAVGVAAGTISIIFGAKLLQARGKMLS